MEQVGDTVKIIKNSIRCNRCGDVITSMQTHEYVTCSCGQCSVDGGNEYLKRSCLHSQKDFTELSELEGPAHE